MGAPVWAPRFSSPLQVVYSPDIIGHIMCRLTLYTKNLKKIKNF